jgi:DNA polymerase-1
MSAGVATERIFLVDAHSLIFQVFHATAGSMSSPTGLPTNALHGFVRDLLFLRGLQPDYLACAIDLNEPTFRSDLYAEYKAHRSPMPEDLVVQIPHIWRAVEAMGIPLLSHPKYEADDVLATVAVAAEKRGLDVRVCTSDKDCRQLITDHVKIYSMRKRLDYGREELFKDWGISPEQVIDFQTLVGDSVDNVPGVPGIGEKTAGALLHEYHTLDGVFANIDKISGAKRKENLRAAKETVPLTRSLVRLSTEVPIALDFEAWRVKALNVPRLLELCKEWGFRSLAEQIKAQGGPAMPRERTLFDGVGANADLSFNFGANAVNGEAEASDGEATEAAPAELTTASNGWVATYHLVDTDEKFGTFLCELKQQKRIALDLETTGLESLQTEIVGYAFSWKTGEGWYLPVRGPAGASLLDSDATLNQLRPVLEDAAVTKVNQNIKYDLLVLRGCGIAFRGVAGDPMVADYLLNAGERSRSKEDLARRHLRHQATPIEDLIGKKGRKAPQKRMDEVDPAAVVGYAAQDADIAWRLCDRLEPALNPELRRLYDELEIPLIDVLAEMEFNGISLDVPLLKRISGEMEKELQQIEQEIYAIAGHEFNIGSLSQLRTVLFDELKLPRQRRTGITRSASTDQDTLEKLAASGHPGAELPAKILEQRQLAKLKSTYVDALPALLNPKTHRLHTSFNQTVAATGRLSSSDPNLQNIPVRRERGQQIRQAFLPRAGWKLLCADYSQIELRLLAQFCGDPTLRRAFIEDQDVHAAVAAQVFNVAADQVTAEMRRRAKVVNFGIIYGMSAYGLSQRLGMDRDDAVDFIDAYFERYPKVLQYQARLLADCHEKGYVGTILGRRRPFDRQAVRPHSTYQRRNQTEREAINTEIQGSAADLIKLAMLNLHRRLKSEPWQARMLLQIHDELVFEAPPEEIERLAAMVRAEMTTPLEKRLQLEVPLKVDVSAGPNWLDVA